MGSLLEHSDVLLPALITGLGVLGSAVIAMFSWFIVNTLAKIDANQTKLFDSVAGLAAQVAQLQTGYEMIVKFILERKSQE